MRLGVAQELVRGLRVGEVEEGVQFVAVPHRVERRGPSGVFQMSTSWERPKVLGMVKMAKQ
ncbi:hypothetical protein SHKM778_49940 [Streptomyces sp. KM77-8]|uniref:Uncharacterized protein n=1 Tax=Streptomyces haneummycinicus TaxID=3074435 RepID=A0AAT9HMN6_9ACTN